MSNRDVLSELPKGWAEVELGELVVKIANGLTQRQGESGKGVPVTRIETISHGKINLQKVGYIDGLSDESIEKYKLLSGDVLFSHINSDLHLGKTAVFRMLNITLLHGMNLLLIRPEERLTDSDYLHYFFNHYRFSGRFISIAQHAVNQSSINQAKLKSLKVLLAPLSEQQRIVAEIEKHLTRLDAAVNALKRIKANLKRYRASVLKAACEGRLVPTEAELAKAEERDYEPADRLLPRILKERRAKWEADQLTKMKAQGKTPAGDKWKAKYEEPASPDASNITDLPEGWGLTFIRPLLSTVRAGMKTGPFGSLLKKHEHKAEGVPVLGIENIAAMKFIAGSKIHISRDKAEQLSGYDARPGDVLISRSGTVGEVCVVPEGLGEARMSTNLVRITLAHQGMLPMFFAILVNGSPFVLKQVSELCKGSTRDFLNQDILSTIVFLLPPLAEQQRIVAEVERHISIIEELETVVEANLTRAERLRQSILKRAFEGKLVPQDPNDEPASNLLERIRAEREKKLSGVKAGMNKRRAGKTTQPELNWQSPEEKTVSAHPQTDS